MPMIIEKVMINNTMYIVQEMINLSTSFFLHLQSL